ncbi:MAG: hypothetical protein JWO30_4680 [Fibrobacteres bacterium]|nr:hypothetical protein [Fibrobacterota bacterium]
MKTLDFLGIRALQLDFFLLKHVGEKIRTRILKSGYASVELYAHENNIPKSTLSEIITGKNDPRLTTLAKICAGLGISLSELFRDPAIEGWVSESAPTYKPRHSSPARKGSKGKDGKKV